MSEASELFFKDVFEKKRNGRAAHQKVRSGGKYMRTPSDNLTKEELNKMNSPCVTYEIKKPLYWREFKKLPDDIQVEYWRSVDRRFETNAAQMAKMFGVSAQTVSVWMKAHKIKAKSQGNRIDPKALDVWEEWVNSRRVSENAAPVISHSDTTSNPNDLEKVALDEVRCDTTTKEPLLCQTVAPVIDDPLHDDEEAATNVARPVLADIISALVGTGAKLTIEVTL